MKENTVGETVLFPELSYRVMEVMFEVHNILGPGFTEDFYTKAVAYELQKHQIPFETEKTIDVYYKDLYLGTYRLDFLVDRQIILELKAVSSLNDSHKQQLVSYLKATSLRLGNLLNFGARKLEYTRIANTPRTSYAFNS
jgi:GxxExxY protein